MSINVSFYQPIPLLYPPLGLFLSVFLEPFFLLVALALSLASLPILLSLWLHSLLAKCWLRMRIGTPSAYVSIHQQHTPACTSKDTLIFQLDRANLSGSKNKTKTQFPLTLNRESQTLARGESEGDLYNLQTVVVHQGNSTKQGNFVTFLKPAAGPHWALFDDHKVQWVS